MGNVVHENEKAIPGAIKIDEKEFVSRWKKHSTGY